MVTKTIKPKTDETLSPREAEEEAAEEEEKEERSAEEKAAEDCEKPSASPDPEDDERYMMFRHYDKGDDGNQDASPGGNDNEDDPATHHVIPKSPSASQRSRSMRGRGIGPPPGYPANPSAYYYHHPPPPGYAAEYAHYGDSPQAAAKEQAAITPGSPHKSSAYYMYPPSSPIKASNSIDLAGNDDEEQEEDEEMGEEWMPPPSSRRKAPPPSEERIAATSFASSAHASEGGGEGGPAPPPPYHYFNQPPTPQSYYPYPYGPSLSFRSKSADSSESPYQLPPADVRGGRVQLVGAGHEWDGLHRTGSWSLVSRSRSIESGGSSEIWDPPRPMRKSMVPTPGRPPVSGEAGVSAGLPLPPSPYGLYPPPGSSGHAERSPYPYAPVSSGGYGDYPYAGAGGRYHPYPPPHPYSSYPTPHHEEDLSHPLLKDYNPHADGVRPQFTNLKKTPKRPVMPANRPMSPMRRRRRRDPNEKAAAAAAMAAAAKAAADEAASKRGDDEKPLIGTETISENELKKLGSGDDEDIPAVKRAVMASALALRAAAAGSDLEPPKASREVDFDIVQPPLLPVVLPGIRPVLNNASLMGENDVLCGRGGGTNSQMGNRRFRALVRDFQPTYLMAKRRDKPLMARSVVLIVRHRGGRFLRRNETDGKLYEVGDEKAEAKTSQALREGLDVRATKTAANTLLGSDASHKKRRRSPSVDEKESMAKFSEKAKKPAHVKFPPPRMLASYMPRGPPLQSHHPYYYRGYPPPPPPPGYERAPPGSYSPYHPPPAYHSGYPPPYHPYITPVRPGTAPIVSPARAMTDKKTLQKPPAQATAAS